MTQAEVAHQAKPPLVTRWGLAAYAIAAVVVVLDQVSKAWILGPLDLPGHGQIEVLPFFRLSMVWNPGVSFGMLATHGDLGRWLLVGFASAVVVALSLWARTMTRALSAVAVGLVIGGAIGNNIVDRVHFGKVVDFLDFSGLGFRWVFNVADSAISMGVGLLILEMLLSARSGQGDAPS
jgi:signal peptidase II